jgi:hypothetical protein
MEGKAAILVSETINMHEVKQCMNNLESDLSSGEPLVISQNRNDTTWVIITNNTSEKMF